MAQVELCSDYTIGIIGGVSIWLLDNILEYWLGKVGKGSKIAIAITFIRKMLRRKHEQVRSES